MTIIQLEYLLAVVNNGSFSLAAEKCFVTQPSLSMQIKNLEEELGITILDRSKKPVVPTQIGEIVVEKAKEALYAYNNIKESVSELKGSIAGKLRLGVIPTIAPYLLPRFIHEFSERYPKVELEVKEIVTPEIIKAFDKDELDAAIVAGGTCPERISEDELFSDKFFVYLSQHNPLYERTNIRIEDINSKQLILLSEGHCLRNQILELCGSIRNTAISYYFESGSLETLMRIVNNTELMTIIPEMSIDYIPQEYRNNVKPLAKGATSRMIALAMRRTYAKERVIKALKEVILEVASVQKHN